jgi:hypothetical protein
MRFLLLLLLAFPSRAAESWADALAQIPIRAHSFRAHKTEPVKLILSHFKPTPEIRAVVLMPAAADQLYFHDWGRVDLPANPTLLDAVQALITRAELQVTLAPPFLLLHTKIDLTSDPLSAEPGAALEPLQKRKIRGRTYYLDRPYDRILPKIERNTRLKLTPKRSSTDSWHFYRLAFVGYDLTGPELLRAIAYGTKTTVQVAPKKAHFRDRPTPR